MSTRLIQKRARTSSLPDAFNKQEDSGVESIPITRDEEFWYSDGNVILISRCIEFRVYKGVLASYSPVFKDMFSLPQPCDESPSTTMPTDDSCPIVHISESPEDLRHILRVYMPRLGGPSPAFHTSIPTYSYDAVAAAVRLGHKYQMSDLLNDALTFLKTYYPTDFDKWKANTRYGSPGFSRERAIGVVNLARLTDDVDLLLMALLVCCTIDKPETIVGGFARADGSREQLAPADLGLCYAAKARLTAASARLMLRVFLPEVPDTCKTPPGCMQGFQRIVRAFGDAANAFEHPDPSFRSKAYEAAYRKGGLCVCCRAVVSRREIYERRAAWAKLPEAFGLDLRPQSPLGACQAGV